MRLLVIFVATFFVAGCWPRTCRDPLRSYQGEWPRETAALADFVEGRCNKPLHLSDVEPRYGTCETADGEQIVWVDVRGPVYRSAAYSAKRGQLLFAEVVSDVRPAICERKLFGRAPTCKPKLARACEELDGLRELLKTASP